jgi:D-arabinose 1-dehydrogenase-like Zn-dependent alcohol dehydrogenase
MKRREAMRALVLEEFGGPLTLKDMAIPRLHFHEVLVGERNVRMIMGSCAAIEEGLQETLDLVAQERLRTTLDRIFPLEGIALPFEAPGQRNWLGAMSLRCNRRMQT